MRVLADTNGFYYLGNGLVNLSDICSPADTLCLSPISVLEIVANTDRHSLDEKRRACRAILESNATMLDRPDQWVLKALGIDPPQPLDDWIGIVQKYCDAAFFEGATGRLKYWCRDERRNRRWTADLDIGFVNRWNAEAERGWVEGWQELIEQLIPEVADWWSEHETPRPAIDPALKRKVKEVAKGSLIRAKAVTQIRTRFRIPPTVSSADIERVFLPYIEVMVAYTFLLIVGGENPVPNDRWDSELFYYLSEPDVILVTADKPWKRRADMTDHGCRVVRLMPRNPIFSATNIPADDDSQSVVRKLAYSNWLRRGKPEGDDWTDWFAAERELGQL